MRRLPAPLSSLLRWKSFVGSTQRRILAGAPILSSWRQLLPSRHLAQVRTEPFSEVWFTPSSPGRSPAEDLLSNRGNGGDHKPPDERTLKLGETLRRLSPLLPNVLSTPLPPDLLSSSVSLHLFPSTHPHLPAVKGKVAYRAALWTAPVAWGSVPLVGNVKLHIISEKIVRTGFVNSPRDDDDLDLGEEKLVVRWKTEKKRNGSATTTSSQQISPSSPSSSTRFPSSNNTTSTTTPTAQSSSETGINRGLSTLLGGDKPIFNLLNASSGDDEFTGLFIFSFDSEGRIATHTIEHADESGSCDKTSRVVTLTDWLLGKARWSRAHEDELVPGLAMRICRAEWAATAGGSTANYNRLIGRGDGTRSQLHPG